MGVKAKKLELAASKQVGTGFVGYGLLIAALEFHLSAINLGNRTYRDTHTHITVIYRLCICIEIYSVYIGIYIYIFQFVLFDTLTLNTGASLGAG